MMLVGWTALSVEMKTKFRTPNSWARFGQHLGAADVVADRFADVQFHQRHVLVRGGVEDDLGTELCEELPHAGLVGDVGDARSQRASA